MAQIKHKGRYRAPVALALVIAVSVSLWFAAPVSALSIDVTEPTTKYTGRNTTFEVSVNIEETDLLPVQSISLDIYKTDNPSVYFDRFVNLPLVDTGGSFETYATQGSGNSARVKATAASGWGYGYGYRHGYGYEQTGGYDYYYFGYGYGWGYGYSPNVGVTSITYLFDWTIPNWPAGTYQIKVSVQANGETFVKTGNTFSLTTISGGGGGAAPPPQPGVTNVSNDVTSRGEFTADVTAPSEDGKVTISIHRGVTGLTKYGDPLSEISIQPVSDPPAPPRHANIIGLAYDLEPDGATFDPAVTITFTYDESLVPKEVAENTLVLAIWDETEGEWVELECTVDTVNNTITAKIRHFTTFTVIATTHPAHFSLSDLSVTPLEVVPGEEVTISFQVTNSGDVSGTHRVALWIDNEVEDRQTVNVAAKASQTVTFTVSKDTVGTYTIAVDGLSVKLVVTPPPTPPAPPEPAPAPVPAPPATPAPPADQINWWLVVGIALVGIIIGLAIWLTTIRGRKITEE